MKKNFLAMVAVGLLAGPMSAQAVLLRLDATTLFPNLATSWSADFNDTGNGLFSVSELTSFSGVTCVFCNPDLLFGTLSQAANVSGVSTGTGGTSWIFTRPAGALSVSSNTFSYRISSATVTVPEPGTLTLFGLGLAALGLGMRRRKANLFA